VKDQGWHRKAEKEVLRGYLSPWEEVIFAEHYGADNMAKGEAGYAVKCDELRGFVFEPLRSWFKSAWEQSGLTRRLVDDACRTSNVTQYWFLERNYQIPTPDKYAILQRLAPHAFTREYEDLRREYEDLRREYEDLRRPFAVSADVPYTDVWNFPTVAAYPGKHPCEKPLAMMQHIIRTSSRPGAFVLDPFMGSGATLCAARSLGRRAVGVEIEERYCEIAARRLQQQVMALDI
jgi:site-specific DNA-methyltransferase (adenine-specific)